MNFYPRVILAPEQFEPSFKGWIIKGVLNPGVVRKKDGRILLFVRIAESAGAQHESMKACPVITNKEDYGVAYEKIKKGEIVGEGSSGEVFLKNGLCKLSTIAHIRRVLLEPDGIIINSIDQEPFFTGIPGEGEYGVEDPRITVIGEKYYMTYVAVSIREGVSTHLASSSNLTNWKRKGIIFREQNKDVVLFPEKIKGYYVAFHRPEGCFEFSRPNIWISYSPDLTYWGREKTVVQAREGKWDGERIGAGTPPIRTNKGWLIFYHGVVTQNNAKIYRAGALMFDLKNPEKIIARSDGPLFEPKDLNETSGFVNNVVFPTGAVLTSDKKALLVYSGGADRTISVRTIPLKAVFQHLKVA